MVGTPADAATAAEVATGGSGPRAATVKRRPANLVGQTDLPTLAGVLAHCRALVTNDSGAMHLAAAVGVPVTAVFGPTDDHATRPLGDAHAVLTHPVWCRPCMLRECPLDHRCMRGVDAGGGRRGGAKAFVTPGQTPRGLPRSRRHDDRGGRLPRLHRASRVLSVDRRRDSRAQSRGPAGGRGHEPVGRRARVLHRSVRRRGASPHERAARGGRRAHRRVLLLSAPSRRQRAGATPGACDCRKPARGLVDRAANDLQSIPAARSSSATGGSTSSWRARSARARFWCGPDTAPQEAAAARRRRRPTPSSTTWPAPRVGYWEL